MNHNKIMLFVLFVLLIILIDILIWIFSDVFKHKLVWKVGSLVVSVIVTIGLTRWLILPNLTGTNQSEKSKTVVYILITGDILTSSHRISPLSLQIYKFLIIFVVEI